MLPKPKHLGVEYAAQFQDQSIRRFATNKDFQPYSVLDELEKRNLFDLRGTKVTATVNWGKPAASVVSAY